MGVAFVFIIYVFAIGVVALPCIAIGVGMGWWISRRSTQGVRRRFIMAGALLPLAGGCYVIGCIIALAIFGLATGRDFGFGDGFDVPLHNGYHWSAIDEPISACVYPGSAGDMSDKCGGSIVKPNAFMDVLALQEQGDWLAGAYDSREEHFLYREQQRADRWFFFNTKTRERYETKDEASLARYASQHGFALQLESSSEFYGHHRYHWYDAVFALLLLVPPVFALLWLFKRARQLLRESAGTTGPEIAEAT
jgi:hypothetical protein